MDESRSASPDPSDRDPEASSAVAAYIDQASGDLEALVDLIVDSGRPRGAESDRTAAPASTPPPVRTAAAPSEEPESDVLILPPEPDEDASEATDGLAPPRTARRPPVLVPKAGGRAPPQAAATMASVRPNDAEWTEQETLPPADASAGPTADGALASGDVICGRYRVLDVLGEGGMAIVYRVEHCLLEKQMALKMLRPEFSILPYAVQRFQREARAVCQLDDPHIVRVTDFGKAEIGSFFLVMELLDGHTLATHLTQGTVGSVEEALLIAEDVLKGLVHAHAHRVVHRDLKPENVILVPIAEDGRSWRVKIVDFGIMKLTEASVQMGQSITQQGLVFGTPRYMSPEQAAGEEVDARTDLYAVGVLLYEMLTGRRPFEGENASQILGRVLVQAPPPMRLVGLDPERAERLEAIVLRALAKDPAERFPDAAAFGRALSSFRAERP